MKWKSIEGYHSYEVSSTGLVKRTTGAKGTHAGRLLKLFPGGGNNNYLRVSLWNEGVGQTVYVHQLVAGAFLGRCPKKHEINHKNGDTKDNTVENLEYVTSRENKEHAVRLRLVPAGLMHWNGRFKPEHIHAMRVLAREGFSQYFIAKLFGCAQPYVGKVVKGEKRRYD